jgi:paraquat-inducible protein B
MNKKISPTLIGGFVIGALALLVIAVIAFGSGQLFRTTREFVLYFDSSVNGLRIGAPVKVRGVEIGAVKDIRFQLDEATQVNKIPVIIEIDLEKLTSRGANAAAAEDLDSFHKMITERGLRGQLMTESLLTGLLYVGLDFFPGAPIDLVQKTDRDHKYPEIPTMPSYLEQAQDTANKILSKLEEVDFKGMMDSAKQALDGVSRLVNSPSIQSSLKSLEQTMPKIDEAVVGIHKMTTNLDGNITELSANLQQTSDAARDAMKQAALAMKQADVSLKEAEAAMTNIRSITDPDSAPFYELSRSLREVSAAARSLRLLSNYVERNPRALIFGKPDSGEGR